MAKKKTRSKKKAPSLKGHVFVDQLGAWELGDDDLEHDFASFTFEVFDHKGKHLFIHIPEVLADHLAGHLTKWVAQVRRKRGEG